LIELVRAKKKNAPLAVSDGNGGGGITVLLLVHYIARVPHANNLLIVRFHSSHVHEIHMESVVVSRIPKPHSFLHIQTAATGGEQHTGSVASSRLKYIV
jgi:hypothetical protein